MIPQSGARTTGSFTKDIPLAGREVQNRTERDGEGTGEIVVHVQGTDEEAHQGQVPEDGDYAVARVEAQEATGDIARGPRGRCFQV